MKAINAELKYTNENLMNICNKTKRRNAISLVSNDANDDNQLQKNCIYSLVTDSFFEKINFVHQKINDSAITLDLLLFQFH